MDRGVHVALVTGPDDDRAPCGSPGPLGPRRADRRVPGRPDPGVAARRRRPAARAHPRPPAAARRGGPRGRSPGRGRSAWSPTSTTSSGSSSRPTIHAPRTTRRSSAPGRSSSRTSPTWIRRPISKVLAVGEDTIPEAGDGRRADARFAGRAAVTLSHPRFLEFLAPGVSKALGVRHLARRGRRAARRTSLAIGDQFNDLEMLAAVGHGAAMPTAPEARPAAARYVAPPVAEEGVADLIEQLVLASPADAARAAARLAREHDAGLGRPDRRHDRPDRRRTTPPAGAVAIEALRAGGIVALPTDTVYGIAVALDDAGRDRGAVRGQGPAAGPGDHAAPRRRGPGAGDRGCGRGRGRARRGVLAGRADGRRAAARRRRPAARPDRRRPDDRAPRPGPRRAAGARARPSARSRRRRRTVSGAAGGRRRRRRSSTSSATPSRSSSTADRRTAAPPSTVVDCTIDPPRILRQGAIARADVERPRPPRRGGRGLTEPAGPPRDPGGRRGGVARHGKIGAGITGRRATARPGCVPGGRRGPAVHGWRSGAMGITDQVRAADATIADLDPELWAAMEGERRRQHDKIELIASRELHLRGGMEAQGSWLTNKYAEGLPGKRYYGGCEFVDIAETLARDRALAPLPRRRARQRPAPLRRPGEHGRLLQRPRPGRPDPRDEPRPGRPPDPRHEAELLRPPVRGPRLRRPPGHRADRLRRARGAGRGGPARS